MSKNKKKDPNEMDPELLMQKKFHAKCLFRALGRMVMANGYWLIEGIDDYEGVEDVKRRVAQAVRGKKKKQLLSINDKALLNKVAAERTDHEKQYLYRIIGGLKCFKRYPHNVKKKLAAVTYFRYFGPNRTVVREQQEAHATYFIVTGDVTVSHLIWDELLQEKVSVDIGVMHPGDLFGEVSLLHNIPRTATVTTNNHCEFLVLLKDDFKNVLQASIQEQWDVVHNAMLRFSYFQTMDDVSLREGCIVAKMKSYNINDTLLGDGKGIQNYVYFVLSGQCQMIESFKIITTRRLGRNYYTLYDPYIPEAESKEDLDKYFVHYQNQSSSDGLEEAKTEVRMKSKSTIKQQSIMKQGSKTSLSNVRSQVQFEAGNRKCSHPDLKELLLDKSDAGAVRSSSNLLFQGKDPITRPSVRISIHSEDANNLKKIDPPNIKTYFMQVLKFNPGASFGFGENMRDRRIVALTPVSCLLLPKVWLLQKNHANIWTRIQYYLTKKVPTKKMLFKEFEEQQRWRQYKDIVVEDIVSQSHAINYTTIHDVPYSIRMEDQFDIY